MTRVFQNLQVPITVDCRVPIPKDMYPTREKKTWWKIKAPTQTIISHHTYCCVPPPDLLVFHHQQAFSPTTLHSAIYHPHLSRLLGWTCRFSVPSSIFLPELWDLQGPPRPTSGHFSAACHCTKNIPLPVKRLIAVLFVSPPTDWLFPTTQEPLPHKI